MSAPAIATPSGVSVWRIRTRALVVGEHLVQALVRARRLVGRAAAQLDALAPSSRTVSKSIAPPSRTRSVRPPTRRLRGFPAAASATSPGRRRGRSSRARALVVLDALEDHGRLAHRRAHEPALAREGRRRALAHDPPVLAAVRLAPDGVVVVVDLVGHLACRGSPGPRRRRRRAPRTRSRRRATSPRRTPARGRCATSEQRGRRLHPARRPPASARKPDAVLWPKPREPKCTPTQTQPSSSSNDRRSGCRPRRCRAARRRRRAACAAARSPPSGSRRAPGGRRAARAAARRRTRSAERSSSITRGRSARRSSARSVRAHGLVAAPDVVAGARRRDVLAVGHDAADRRE